MPMTMKTTVIDLTVEEARQFFIRQEVFCNIGLPQYFDFQKLLNSCFNLKKNELNELLEKGFSPGHFSDVNYIFFKNKDGRFSWRPLQIINPIIYVFLVKEITKQENWDLIVNRFKEFQKNDKIKCCSIPVVNHSPSHSDSANMILNWWNEIEQTSLRYSMNYNYLLITDITDCYGSIYTHSISWALHGKEGSKTAMKNGTVKKLFGNRIDCKIQEMSFNQTNGIPQGSVLMDFIAEMVLGYADLELSNKIDPDLDFRILRYRDDYRIFGKTQEDVMKVAKALTEVLADLNLRLNTQKTSITQDLISDAIKPDKLFYINNGFKELECNQGYTLQKQLLRIYKLSQEYPNSGYLKKSMEIFFKRLCEIDKLDLFKETESSEVLVSIVTNIAYNNPKIIKEAVAIIGQILCIENDSNKVERIYEQILNKFKGLPNTEYLNIWMQRLTIKNDRKKDYADKLCKYAANPNIENCIWNISWLKSDYQIIFERNPIVNEAKIAEMPSTIEYKEIETFSKY